MKAKPSLFGFIMLILFSASVCASVDISEDQYGEYLGEYTFDQWETKTIGSKIVNAEVSPRIGLDNEIGVVVSVRDDWRKDGNNFLEYDTQLFTGLIITLKEYNYTPGDEKIYNATIVLDIYEQADEVIPERPVCTETDDGRDYYTKGTATVDGKSRTDECIDETDLMEIDCGWLGYIEHQDGCGHKGLGGCRYECPHGCEDGACKEAPEELDEPIVYEVPAEEPQEEVIEPVVEPVTNETETVEEQNETESVKETKVIVKKEEPSLFKRIFGWLKFW